MNVREGIKAVLKDNHKTQVWLMGKMGYTTPSGINRLLSRNNLTIKTLYRICEILDYEITIQPKRRAGTRPQGQIVFDFPEINE